MKTKCNAHKKTRENNGQGHPPKPQPKRKKEKDFQKSGLIS